MKPARLAKFWLSITVLLTALTQGHAAAQSPPPVDPDRESPSPVGPDRENGVVVLHAPPSTPVAPTRLEVLAAVRRHLGPKQPLEGSTSPACDKDTTLKAAKGGWGETLDRYCERSPRFSRLYAKLPKAVQNLGPAAVCQHVNDLRESREEAEAKLQTRKNDLAKFRQDIKVASSDTERKDLEKKIKEMDADVVADERNLPKSLSPDEVAMADECERARNVAGGGALVLAAVVGGLGDFLKDRAKKELVAYAVNVLGRHVCDKDSALRVGLTVAGEFPFEESCAAAYPDGDDLDYQAFEDGRFQKAFLEEARALPIAMLNFALAKLGHLKKNQRLVLGAVARALYGEVSPLFRGATVDASGIIGRIDVAVAARLKEESGDKTLGCSRPKSFGLACGALLALRLAAGVEAKFGDGSGTLDDLALAKEATESFCRDYGAKAAPPEKPEDKDSETTPSSGACVSSAWNLTEAAEGNEVVAAAVAMTDADSIALLDADESTTDIMGDLLAMVRRFRDAQELFKDARDTSDDAQKKARMAAGLRMLFEPIFDLARRQAGSCNVSLTVDATDEQRAACARRQGVRIAELGADAVLALMQRDLPAVVVSLKAVLALPTVKEALGERGVRAISFVLDIGAVKDADEARKVIEGAAEPLGSYRAKYDADFVISVNGYVGTMVGGRVLFNRGAGVDGARASPELEMRPLTGPVGVDFSGRCDAQHFGVMVTVLDPLAMVTVDGKDGTEVDWGGVLVPGVLVRWGIQRSPIVLYAAAQYQPLRQPQPVQVAGKDVLDFEGAFAFGGGFAVDIPLFMVYAD